MKKEAIKNMFKKLSVLQYIVVIFLLSLSFIGAATVLKDNTQIIDMSASTIEHNEVDENGVSVVTEQLLEFTVLSDGRGQLSSFYIDVLTTNGDTIEIGEFSFLLRTIEEITAHDAHMENYIDYVIPMHWNSSQTLTETIEVRELRRNPIRAAVADEPLFYRTIDYPTDVPFEEIEIQVDGLKYFTDTNETEYVAWVRFLEVEKYFNIEEIIVRPYVNEEQ